MQDVLIGAGGHARVVYDALQQAEHDTSHLVVRGNSAGSLFHGHSVQTPEVMVDMSNHRAHVAIGHNQVRADLLTRAQGHGAVLWTIVHPKAIVAGRTDVAGGCFLAAGAILGPDTRLEAGCILNHGCVVDHDCKVGEFCHIAPGSVLGGGVILGNGCLVGSNSTVLPGVTIGSNVIIGAGSIVTKNVPSDSVWVGTRRRAQ